MAFTLADRFDVLHAGWKQGLVESGDVIRQHHVRLLLADLVGSEDGAARQLAEFHAIFPFVRIVAVLPEAAAGLARELLSNSVRSLVAAEDPVADLRRAVLLTTQGKSFVSPVVGRRFLEVPEDDTLEVSSELRLSARQRRIFELRRMGWQRGDIARELCVSPNTVDTHWRRIREKLALRCPNLGSKSGAD